MTARGRLIVAVILATALPSVAVDTKGWYYSYCDSAEIHLTTFPGQHIGNELRLSVHTSFPGPSPQILWSHPGLWMGQMSKVKGRRCDRTGKCDDATHADFEVTGQTKRHISGRYHVEFDAQYLGGEFSASYRKGPSRTCE